MRFERYVVVEEGIKHTFQELSRRVDDKNRKRVKITPEEYWYLVGRLQEKNSDVIADTRGRSYTLLHSGNRYELVPINRRLSFY